MAVHSDAAVGAITARQSISGPFPLETPQITVGNDRFRANVSAAVLGAEILSGPLARFDVEIRHEAVTEAGFEAQPVVTVTIDGSVVYARSFGTEADEVLASTVSDDFNYQPLEDGDHEVCVSIRAPGAVPGQ